MSYILSWYRKAVAPVLVRRPWWNLFGRDKIGYKSAWDRVVVTGLSEEEKDIFLSDKEPQKTLMYRLMGSIVSRVQLENGPHSAPYITTTKQQGEVK